MAYGPGEQDENKLLPHVIRTLLRGKDPKLSSGKRGVDWVYVDDVTEGLVRVAERAGALAGQRVDIGSGELVEVREVVERVYRLVSPGRTPLLGTLSDRADEAIRRADMVATRGPAGLGAGGSAGRGFRSDDRVVPREPVSCTAESRSGSRGPEGPPTWRRGSVATDRIAPKAKPRRLADSPAGIDRKRSDDVSLVQSQV